MGLGRQREGNTQPVQQSAFGSDEYVKKPDAEQHVEADQIAQAYDQQVGVKPVTKPELTDLNAPAGDAETVDDLDI